MRQNAVLFSNWTCSFLPLPQNWIRTCLPILVKKKKLFTFSHFLAEDLQVSPYFSQSNLMHSIWTLFCLAFKACPSLPQSSTYLNLFSVTSQQTPSVQVIWISQNPAYSGPCLFSSFGSSYYLNTWAHFLCTWPRSSCASKPASGLAKICLIIILLFYHPWHFGFLSLQLENTTYWRKKIENFLYDLLR